jgi:hypothetical protein
MEARWDQMKDRPMPARGKTDQRGKGPRKRRYVADLTTSATVTPLMLVVLRWLASFGFLTGAQMARLAGRSEQAVRRVMRVAFDLGLVRIVVVPRVALLPDLADPLSASFGSAPNIFALSAKGIRLLGELGGTNAHTFPVPSALFMRHELGVRDCLIAFFAAAQSAGHEVEAFNLGADAAIELGRSERPRTARPDALIAYRFGERVLAAAIEFDTGSERGPSRWADKLTAYRLLLSGDRFSKALRYTHGKVIVVCTTAGRRDHLAAFIRERAEAPLAERFWLAASSDLAVADLSLSAWRRPSHEELQPLIPPEISGAAPGAEQETTG